MILLLGYTLLTIKDFEATFELGENIGRTEYVKGFILLDEDGYFARKETKFLIGTSSIKNEYIRERLKPYIEAAIYRVDGIPYPFKEGNYNIKVYGDLRIRGKIYETLWEGEAEVVDELIEIRISTSFKLNGDELNVRINCVLKEED